MEMFQIYGSVIPRSIPFAIVGSIQGALMKATVGWGWDVFGLEYQETWFHPYTMHVLGMVLGFSLVMRIQIAYARFWEGATQCHQASSKWADAAMQVMAFDEASKDAFTEQARPHCAHHRARFACWHPPRCPSAPPQPPPPATTARVPPLRGRGWSFGCFTSTTPP